MAKTSSEERSLLRRLWDGVVGNLGWAMFRYSLVFLLPGVSLGMSLLMGIRLELIFYAIAAFSALGVLGRWFYQPMLVLPHDLLRRSRACWRGGRPRVEGIQCWDGQTMKEYGKKAQIHSQTISRRRVSVIRSSDEGRVAVWLQNGDGGDFFRLRNVCGKPLAMVSFWFRGVCGRHTVEVQLKDKKYLSPDGVWGIKVDGGESTFITATFPLARSGHTIEEFGIVICELAETTPSKFEISKLQLCVIDSETVFC